MSATEYMLIPPTANGNQDVFYLGIDGGGSKCCAKVQLPNGVSGIGMGGPANPMHGVEQTITSILESTKRALSAAGLSRSSMGKLIAGVGLAGVNLPKCYSAIRDWDHPFKDLFVTTDVHIACLGAHRGGDGAVLIIGTGSSGFASLNNRSIYLGGHGFPHGDKGSGAWIGFEAYRYSLMALDGMGSPTLLAEKLLREFDANDAFSLVAKLRDFQSYHFARLAPLVFKIADQGDEVAINIINEGAAYLSNLAYRLLEHYPPRLSVLGGLTSLMLPWLAQDIKDIVSSPLDMPETGAIYFAKQSFRESHMKSPCATIQAESVSDA